MDGTGRWVRRGLLLVACAGGLWLAGLAAHGAQAAAATPVHPTPRHASAAAATNSATESSRPVGRPALAPIPSLVRSAVASAPTRAVAARQTVARVVDPPVRQVLASTRLAAAGTGLAPLQLALPRFEPAGPAPVTRQSAAPVSPPTTATHPAVNFAGSATQLLIATGESAAQPSKLVIAGGLRRTVAAMPGRPASPGPCEPAIDGGSAGSGSASSFGDLAASSVEAAVPAPPLSRPLEYRSAALEQPFAPSVSPD
jgi:hypothetical protein